jgi:hypothetical protein
MKTRKAVVYICAGWHHFTHNDQVKLSILALIIGVGVAYGALGFRIGIEAIQSETFGLPLQNGFHLIA